VGDGVADGSGVRVTAAVGETLAVLGLSPMGGTVRVAAGVNTVAV